MEDLSKWFPQTDCYYQDGGNFCNKPVKPIKGAPKRAWEMYKQRVAVYKGICENFKKITGEYPEGYEPSAL